VRRHVKPRVELLVEPALASQRTGEIGSLRREDDHEFESASVRGSKSKSGRAGGRAPTQGSRTGGPAAEKRRSRGEDDTQAGEEGIEASGQGRPQGRSKGCQSPTEDGSRHEPGAGRPSQDARLASTAASTGGGKEEDTRARGATGFSTAQRSAGRSVRDRVERGRSQRDRLARVDATWPGWRLTPGTPAPRTRRRSSPAHPCCPAGASAAGGRASATASCKPAGRRR